MFHVFVPVACSNKYNEMKIMKAYHRSWW